jgi:hypothetical protein
MQQETACGHASNRLLIHAIWYTWIIRNTSIEGNTGVSGQIVETEPIYAKLLE